MGDTAEVIGVELDARVETRTRRVIVCPRCGEVEYGIDHLIDSSGPRSWGPWYCDECGCGFSGTTHPDGRTTIRIDRQQKIKTRVLLRLAPTDKPIHIEVEGMRFTGGPDDAPEEDDGHSRYFYEEHTCAVNFLRQVIETWEGAESDPHGLFTFVRQVDAPEEYYERAFNADGLALGEGDRG